MEKTARAVVHEIAEIASLTSFSFGQEEEDRYVMLWKKKFAPSDEEVLAYRKGEEWDPEKARKLKEAQERLATENQSEGKKVPPTSNYKDKYKHLIGDTSAKAAAQSIYSDRSYGFACPGVFQNISGYMLMAVPELLRTYDEAISTCAVCSASLVRIDSPEKQTAIQAYLYTLEDSRYWIQCRKDTSDGMWKFDDGTPVPMTNDYWSPNRPSLQTLRYCGYMHYEFDYRWFNNNCDLQFCFICEIK